VIRIGPSVVSSFLRVWAYLGLLYLDQKGSHQAAHQGALEWALYGQR